MPGGCLCAACNRSGGSTSKVFLKWGLSKHHRFVGTHKMLYFPQSNTFRRSTKYDANLEQLAKSDILWVPTSLNWTPKPLN